MIVKFKKISEDAKLPTYAHPGDAGMDVYSNEDYILKPNERHIFSTGVASDFPSGYVALVWDKGGFGAKGIHRFSGVIDAGYRGEWLIILHNFTQENLVVEKGDKIAQVLIQKVEIAEIIEVDGLEDSARGDGKFGSTGKK
jgi:dUTP pyrophosphatase